MKIYTREQNCYKNMQITIIGLDIAEAASG
jgi:hypothetical protein